MMGAEATVRTQMRETLRRHAAEHARDHEPQMAEAMGALDNAAESRGVRTAFARARKRATKQGQVGSGVVGHATKASVSAPTRPDREVFCTAGPLPDPGFTARRKCHRLVGSGVEGRTLRGIRDQHEGWCRGTDVLSKTCRLCAVVFEPGPPGSRMQQQGDSAHKMRRAHERRCERAAARAAAAAVCHPGGAPAGDPGALPIAPVVAAG